MSKEAMKLALETSEGIVNADWRKWDELASPEEFERWVKSRANHMASVLREALAEQPACEHEWLRGGCLKCGQSIEQPAQQEPVAFPARKAVEREIERTANPTGMHLNDGKERVALPGGTLRHMLALIDRTPSPPQRTWVGLTDEERHACTQSPFTTENYWAIEAKLKEKNQ